MTTMKDATSTLNKMTLAEVFESLLARPVPIRFTAYDGSSSGPDDASGHRRAQERAWAVLPDHRTR